LRVGFLIDRLGPAGTESQLLALIRHLDRRRVEPYLFLLDGADAVSRALEPRDCPVLRLGVRSLHKPRTLRQAWRFARFLRDEQIDILQVYFPDSTYFGVLAGRLAGVRRIIGTRFNLGYWMRPLHRWLGRFYQHLIDATIANCEACRQAVIADEGADPERVHVLENGVVLAETGYVPIGDRPRRCVGLVANLRPVKDPETFVRAARRVVDRFADARFFIAGEGEMRPTLEALIDTLHLREHVTLLGNVPDVPRFLTGIDIGVLCSLSEGSSNSLLEYMAAGRAVVATAVGGTLQMIEHGKHGLLVPPGDSQRLADAIGTLFDTPGHAAELASAARQRVRECYNLKARARKFERFYARLANDKNASPEPRVLTDVPGRPGRFWGDHSVLVGPTKPATSLTRWLGARWAERITGIVAALHLFLRRRHAPGVVTGGGPCGMFFAWLQALVPWGRRPHVMVDCNWYVPDSRWKRWLKTVERRLAARSVQSFVVWARHELTDYANTFGIAAEKFRYVPFHSTLDNYQYEVRDDGYLFAGGNYDRDYRTLVEAVRPLGVPVWIATTRRNELLNGVNVPPHIRVEGTTHAGFRQALAGAKLVVVPMQGGLLHSGGQQTLLNAMVMGKPTIAVGRAWAEDFLTHGDNGLIVDYEDVQGLRDAIRWVLEHPGEAQRLAERGRALAQQFTTRRCMETIYRMIVKSPAA
jgi:glycosyltransferase involved in cell wall biosynthesis